MNDQVIFCKRCILDSSTPAIEFDGNGICNYCDLYDQMDKEYPLDERKEENLNKLIKEIKGSGINKKYDCIAGVSGGTDSTYILYQSKQLGLRPLAVHLDNGWNSDIAVSNIKNAVGKLGIDLFTCRVDWQEFKDLQISFLKASTIDVEIPTDLAINSVLYQTALREGVKYILTGISFRTEGNMPAAWAYGDGKYIRSIQERFGSRKLETYPNLSMTRFFYYSVIKRIKMCRFLNYFAYSKKEAAKTLEKELGWQNYGGHHFESIYTRFFQRYISPVKFGVDRRNVALSAQVRAAQLTREEAFKKLQEEDYKPDQMQADKEYIAKKLGFTEKEFDQILALPPKTFLDYPTNYHFLKRMQFLIRIASKLKLIPMVYHKTKFAQ